MPHGAACTGRIDNGYTGLHRRQDRSHLPARGVSLPVAGMAGVAALSCKGTVSAMQLHCAKGMIHSKAMRPMPAMAAIRSPGRALQSAGLGVVRQRSWTCQAASSATTAEIESAKKRLFELAGDNKGFDLSESQLEEFFKAVSDLSDLNPSENPAATDLTGTEWECLFTSSKGPSSGKIGPFIGRNDQEFPPDTPGKYINTLALGPLQAYILASYGRADGDVIRVEFLEQEFSLGPLKKKVEFEKNQMVGTWRMVYQDDDLRMFYTNKGSLFVLTRKQV